MKDCFVSLKYTQTTYDELSKADQALVDAAKTACQTAYAPYSHFGVGAAALLSNGVVVCGSNQENAAFPSGMCAERCAVFYANAQYPEAAVTTLAIAAQNQVDAIFLEHPVPPCGACRQVLLETQQRFKEPMRLLLYGTKEVWEIHNIETLLPFQFSADSMKSESKHSKTRVIEAEKSIN